MLQYFYTKYGDVYSGHKWDELDFPEYTIVIQGTKLQEYRELRGEDKTLNKIREYGWVIHNNTLAGVLDHNNTTEGTKRSHSQSWEGSIERKHLFIIGAGASAFCCPGTNDNAFYRDILRPPLGVGLFDERFKSYYSNYEGVKQTLPILNNTDKIDVEALFENEWQEIQEGSNYNVLSRHINIQYYLQELLRDVSINTVENHYATNLYAILADKLQRIYSRSLKTVYNVTSYQQFAFVSFNQDSILEHFIETYFKRPIKSMSDYANINESPFCIFKPHGSWNWGWRFPNTEKFGNNPSKWLFDNNTNFFQLYYNLLGDHLNMIDWDTWGYEAQNNQHHLGKHTIDKAKLQVFEANNCRDYFPALLLPYRDKDEFTMPVKDFMNMKTYLGLVETIVIIGWKGNEAVFNRHFFNHSHKLKKVIIVDPNAHVVAQNLEPLLQKISKENIIHYKDFEDFVLNGLEKDVT